MPTSLTYIVQMPEAVHLGDLMRIWVRPATKIIKPRSDFQGPTRAFRTPQEGWCFTEASPLSPDNPFPGDDALLTKKRELFPELSPTSPRSIALPRQIQTDRSQNASISVGRVGNINPIPFRYRGLPCNISMAANLTMSGTPSLYRFTGSLRTA